MLRKHLPVMEAVAEELSIYEQSVIDVLSTSPKSTLNKEAFNSYERF
jgi:hypothetical protein